MDGRFLFYEGFGEAAENIFQSFILKYNFVITSKSDYGITFENNKCRLVISYETGLQIWYYDKITHINSLLGSVCKKKGNDICEMYKNIRYCMHGRNRIICMEQLSKFLEDNFSDEFK
jgi:hypothetical protein